MMELAPPALVGFLCGMLAMLAIVGVDKGDLYQEIDRLKRLVPQRGNAKRFVTLKSGKVSAGRIIWLMLHGEWPSKPVLHDNGKRSDNRECNLRHGYVE